MATSWFFKLLTIEVTNVNIYIQFIDHLMWKRLRHLWKPKQDLKKTSCRLSVLDHIFSSPCMELANKHRRYKTFHFEKLMEFSLNASLFWFANSWLFCLSPISCYKRSPELISSFFWLLWNKTPNNKEAQNCAVEIWFVIEKIITTCWLVSTRSRSRSRTRATATNSQHCIKINCNL